jgi:hypothetical protein
VFRGSKFFSRFRSRSVCNGTFPGPTPSPQPSPPRGRGRKEQRQGGQFQTANAIRQALSFQLSTFSLEKEQPA